MDQPSPEDPQHAVTHYLPPQRQDDQDTKPVVDDFDTTDPQLVPHQEATIGYVADQHSVPKESAMRARFGDYEIINELGHGGMGVVYKAKHAGTGRLVALKLIRPDYLGNLLPAVRENALARFRTEVQATALLEHDHVVTVYDVGEIKGQPYYAMRFVEGVSLKDRLTDRPLEPLEAARYMSQIAGALSEAHFRGILHRDVKPHNVMIDQKQDRALLADFGLAKLSEGDQQLTASEVAIGSPPYMSPEQVVDSGKVTVSTDIYGLGATLYHLLTGRPPFQAANAQATMMQVINREPVAVRDLNPLVPQDLETICLKCLEKTPDRRYPTIAEVADRLNKVIRGEPIPERPLSALEKTRRWCVKNPAIASLSVAVLLVLTLGLISSISFALVAQQRAAALMMAYTVLNSKTAELESANENLAIALDQAKSAEAKAQENESRALQQQQVADTERQRAETENRSAQAVRDFLQNNLLRGASPWEQVNLLGAGGGSVDKKVSEVTVLDLLNRAAEDFSPDKIASAFPGQPLVQAQILATIGETYGSLGESEQAVKYVLSAFDTIESVYGATHSDTLAALMNLGFEQLAAGQADEAVASLAKLTDRLDVLSSRATSAPNSSATAPTGDPLKGFDDAFQAVVEVIEKRLDIRRFVLPSVTTNIGARTMSFFRIIQGLPKLGRLVDVTGQRYGELDRRHLFALMAYGFTKHAVGNVASALQTYEKVVEGAEQILEPDHSLLIGCRTVLAITYDTIGREKEKSLLLRENVFASLERVAGPSHPAAITSRVTLASRYSDEGMHERAIELLEAGRQYWEARYGAESDKNLLFLHLLGDVYHCGNRHQEAIEIYTQVIEGKTEVLGRDDKSTQASIYNLANVYSDINRNREAIPLREEVLASDIKRLGTKSAETHTTMRTLAEDCEAIEDFDRAIDYRQQLLTGQTLLMGEKASATLTTMENLARALNIVGRTTEARELLEKIIRLQASNQNQVANWAEARQRIESAIDMIEALTNQTPKEQQQIANCKHWRWDSAENEPVHEFRQVEDKWIEYKGDSSIGTLSELRRTETYIDLHNPESKIYFRLSAKQAFASRSRKGWVAIAAGNPIEVASID
jgi:serine/threonine protein kinase/lipopolysaccharide biosynthesis regulator YciM